MFYIGICKYSFVYVFLPTIKFAEPFIPVTLTPESQFLPAVAPHNTYHLTCTATPPSDLTLPSEIQWINANTEELVIPSSTVTILNSMVMPVSVLSITETTAGSYNFYCRALFAFDGETVASNSSLTASVTVNGKFITSHTFLLHENEN